MKGGRAEETQRVDSKSGIMTGHHGLLGMPDCCTLKLSMESMDVLKKVLEMFHISPVLLQDRNTPV
jgi:hypothetical protein